MKLYEVTGSGCGINDMVVVADNIKQAKQIAADHKFSDKKLQDIKFI